jgi:hypothetical protein
MAAEKKRESDFIVKVKEILNGQPVMSAVHTLTIIDDTWLRAQGVEPDNDDEADNLALHVYNRIDQQFYTLIAGEITLEKLQKYWQIYDATSSDRLEIAWLKLNHPNYTELVKRVEDATALEIQAAKHKKQLIGQWTKQEILDQPEFSYYMNKQQLQDWGVDASEEEEWDSLVQQAANEYERRTGQILGHFLTDEQLDEFEKLMKSGNEAAQIAYIEQAAPYYETVVKAVGVRLGAEIVNADDKGALIKSWK